MLMIRKETIAAISSGLSNAGIGIVRISGEDAITVAEKIFRTKGGLKDKPSHTIHYGHILEEGEIVDEVLLMLMRAPRTYTGEDTVEINCHGGVLLVQKILKLVLKAGARIAEPGEFSKRAFLNGKMDLSKEEAVIDIINAKNTYALKAGMHQLKGNLREKIQYLREEILHESAYIESALDDPENYSLDAYPALLKKKLLGLQEEIDSLIRSFANGKIIKEGIETAIIGKPNAGKSSLMNLLLKEERAIVSDIAGTTRDIIKEYIQLDGMSLNITDTAGIRETEDSIEKIGVDKAKHAAKEADFVILVIDGTKELDREDMDLLDFLKEKKAVILLNKSDEQMLLQTEDIHQYSQHPCIVFSAKSASGLEDLENEIKEIFYRGDLDFNEQIYITNERHIEWLEEAKQALSMVLHSIEEKLPEDFYSIDLLNAYESLGNITGESIGDDLANEIFRKFCMGK